MRPSKPEAFPLFKGATRVPVIWGVPMVPLMMMIMGVAVLAMTISLFWWLMALPLWFIMAQVTKNDDKAFRIWWLWIDTKLRNRNKSFWGASSYNPSDYRKRRPL
ncbi:type IV secretion system protein VirB3 [Bartonella sp. F02]|uniref:type IV secretion system protein VirB3 n=1 Tax=Bartonella sp. F02 TaxID=2967262 RepID=UPI0022A95EA8|nr:VirB3 family type IV secretion system protein [Bartonella sp. F02]MCZ2328769.1 VirB3 family type IV secretion system protein [Bartonella sp. F02]